MLPPLFDVTHFYGTVPFYIFISSNDWYGHERKLTNDREENHARIFSKYFQNK